MQSVPSVNNIVTPLMPTYEVFSCWDLISDLFIAGFQENFLIDLSRLCIHFKEIWYLGSDYIDDILGNLQAWDVLCFGFHSFYIDHVGIVDDSKISFVNFDTKKHLTIEPIFRYKYKIVQIVRLRRLL